MIGHEIDGVTSILGALMGHWTAPPALVDPIEAVLAVALTEAAKAGRFDVVANLAAELQARRLAREPNVVALPRPRALRGT